MTPERWQRVRSLARAALECPPAVRDAFPAVAISALALGAYQYVSSRRPPPITDKLSALVGVSPGGKWLAYIDHRNQNVRAQPLDDGPPRQLTDFKTDQTFSFAFSRDGKQLVLARGTQTNDEVMIADFK